MSATSPFICEGTNANIQGLDATTVKKKEEKVKLARVALSFGLGRVGLGGPAHHPSYASLLVGASPGQ